MSTGNTSPHALLLVADFPIAALYIDLPQRLPGSGSSLQRRISTPACSKQMLLDLSTARLAHKVAILVQSAAASKASAAQPAACCSSVRRLLLLAPPILLCQRAQSRTAHPSETSLASCLLDLPHPWVISAPVAHAGLSAQSFGRLNTAALLLRHNQRGSGRRLRHYIKEVRAVRHP